jgi:hypothetical protein
LVFEIEEIKSGQWDERIASGDLSKPTPARDVAGDMQKPPPPVSDGAAEQAGEDVTEIADNVEKGYEEQVQLETLDIDQAAGPEPSPESTMPVAAEESTPDLAKEHGSLETAEGGRDSEVASLADVETIEASIPAVDETTSTREEGDGGAAPEEEGREEGDAGTEPRQRKRTSSRASTLKHCPRIVVRFCAS